MWYQPYYFLIVPFQILLNKSDFLCSFKVFIKAEKGDSPQIMFHLFSFICSRIFFDYLECNTLILNAISLPPRPIQTCLPLCQPFMLILSVMPPYISVQEVRGSSHHFPPLSHSWVSLPSSLQSTPFIYSIIHSSTYSFKKLPLHAYFLLGSNMVVDSY